MYRQHAIGFQDNKYSRCYFRIIDLAITQNRNRDDGIFENHHILPKSKSLFPQFANLKLFPWNGVLLSPREHYICHMLLARSFIGKQKHAMMAALRRMCFGNNDYAARRYERVRSEWLKLNRGNTHASYGITLSDDVRRKMSESHKGKTKSPEHRAKIGDANRRRNWTTESRAKASASHSGKILSAAHRAKISAKGSGKNNPMFGTKWIYNEERQLSFPINGEKLQEYLDAGWNLGQKKYEDGSGKNRKISRAP